MRCRFEAAAGSSLSGACPSHTASQAARPPRSPWNKVAGHVRREVASALGKPEGLVKSPRVTSPRLSKPDYRTLAAAAAVWCLGFNPWATQVSSWSCSVFFIHPPREE